MSIPIVFVMNEDVNSFRYSLIYDHNYAEWFEEIQANGKNLPESEKKDLVAFIDQMIDQYCEGLPLMYKVLEVANSHDNEYHRIDRVVHSVSLFVLVTIIDILVASKFFLLATKDYERSFMRGKLKVILNEGFKKLYGFEKKTYEKSEWERILPILNHFPESINLQYQKLTELLEKHAHSSSWWKDERDIETHLDAEKLYLSRIESVDESMVIMDSLKLFRTLSAVDLFLTNVHGCLTNALLDMYHKGELKEE